MTQAIVKSDIINSVATKVKGFQQSGDLHLPANYSAENAMKSAYLILQSTVDKNKRPVLESCTRESICNSLLDMAVQGLNPSKKQCYFVAYGKTLICQRSYFGTMAVLKNMTDAKDISAQVVWGDDEFEYNIDGGNKIVTSHKQKLENIGKKPKAGYCTIKFDDGRTFTDIMTIDQIKKSWSKSKMNPNSDTSVHSQFEEEMIRKTVINRACKNYINSSDDSLVVQHFNRADDIEADEAIFQREIDSEANAEVIDIKDDQKHMPESMEPTKEEMAEIQAEEMAQSEAEKNDGGPDF